MHRGIRAVGITLVLPLAAACSPKSTTGGSGGGGSFCEESPSSEYCYIPTVAAISDGNGHTLKTFTPPGDPGPNAFVFTVSGEVNAITGYPYPPYDVST